MSNKPIFVATHPRACSTAFERVFMTRRDTIQCIHEPFGDAFYYGPERLSARFADDEQARIDSGFSQSTFKTIMDRIERESSEGKRIFIKDIIHYLLPPDGKPASIAPSLKKLKRGVGTETETTNGDHPVKGVNGVNGQHLTNGVNGVSGHVENGINGVNGHAVATGVDGVHHDEDHDTVGGEIKTTKQQQEPYPYDTEAEPGNPTVMPREVFAQFHFAFLIRDPHYSVPSYYRCTIPPLDEVTGFYNYDPSEAGYLEVRRTFDYLRRANLVGPRIATRDDLVVDADGASPREINGVGVPAEEESGVEICVVDADEMLDKPAATIEAFCRSVGLDYDPSMLEWDTEEDHRCARDAFEKWRGFHNDAIESKGLKAREHKRPAKTEEEFDAEWREKYGEKGAAIIRKAVDANMADYLYMKQFALKV